MNKDDRSAENVQIETAEDPNLAHFLTGLKVRQYGPHTGVLENSSHRKILPTCSSKLTS